MIAVLVAALACTAGVAWLVVVGANRMGVIS